MLEHKIRPHYYCLPILKREEDRMSLLKEAIKGNENFFLGTDSAPHSIKAKESECGCAGIFNTINSIETLTQLFEDNNSLKNLEKFISFNGPRHYNLYPNKQKIRLHKSDNNLKFKSSLNVNNENFKIFKPPFEVFWKQEN